MRRDAIQMGVNARFLVDSTFNFAERMNAMQLTDTEIGLFCSIVLITPDRPGLRNVELIERMYKKLKNCLQTVIQQNRPDKPDFMSDLLNLMPDLRTLSTLHTEKLIVFRTEHKSMMRQQNVWLGQSGFLNSSASSTASSSIVDDMETSCSKSSSPMMSHCWTNGSEHHNQLRTAIAEQVTSPQSCFDELAKSPMGSVSSTESNDTGIGTIDYSSQRYGIMGLQTSSQQQQQTSSITSSAPLLAATLSGANCCPMRMQSGTSMPQTTAHRVSNSSAEDESTSGSSNGTAVSSIPGPPAAAVHLVQNGLTITPVLRQTPATVPPPSSTTTQIRYRKLDSPTDSGIESGNEKQNEHNLKKAAMPNGSQSACSSPQSSVDDMEHHHVVCQRSPTIIVQQPKPQQPQQQQQTTIDDMPVLKRVLQAPPLYDTNLLMDEAYKPHKKFRAMRHRHGETSAPTNNEQQQSQEPGAVLHHQSQLHMHLTRTKTPVTQQQDFSETVVHSHGNNPIIYGNHSSTSNSDSSNNSDNGGKECSENENGHADEQSTESSKSKLNCVDDAVTPLQQNTSSNSTVAAAPTTPSLLSSLSSTHSVLAKSLMEEPRMTPEQIKRSDIIQNYIMRGGDKPHPYPSHSSASSPSLLLLNSSARKLKQESSVATKLSSMFNGSATTVDILTAAKSPKVIELTVDIAENGTTDKMMAQQPLNLSTKTTTIDLLSPVGAATHSHPSKSSEQCEQQQSSIQKILLEA